jgi:iron-sulfur cluster repair protein YtfE (RIC family)
MLKLLDVLKEEHEVILENLLAVKRYGVHTMEGRNQLMTAKRLLLDHLEKEDHHLYPELNKAAESDLELRERLDKYEQEMSDITEYCIHFFEKYSVGGGGIEFLMDFEKLKKALENRIQKEEKILYVRFERETAEA